jgi:glycine/D-amino acid oxidase-like deaminating enzyme
MIGRAKRNDGRTDQPIWETDAQTTPAVSHAGASGSRIADVVIIGAGFTGLSAAYHIIAARPTAHVVVLEAGRIGRGASGRNSGMLTPGVGQDLATLVRRWGPDTARAMYHRSLDAVKFVEALTARESIEAGLTMTGQLVLAHGRSGRRRVARQAAALEALGLPCERFDDRSLGRRIRIAARAPGGDAAGPAALRLPVAGTLHPGRLLDGLASAVRRRGGMILEGATVTAMSRSSPVCVTLADGMRMTARHVVVATSGYTARLNMQRGRLVPLHLRVLVTEPLAPSVIAGIGWSGREGVIDSRRVFNYFRLTEDDRILFGGGRPQYSWRGGVADRPAEGPEVDRLVKQFRVLFPALRRCPVARSWTGVIAYSLNNLPVIGRAPGHEQVYFAGGWCGHGIALGILSGRWMQQLIDTGRPPDSLPWFRDRAPLTPPEPFRWLAVRAAGRAMELMDRI